MSYYAHHDVFGLLFTENRKLLEEASGLDLSGVPTVYAQPLVEDLLTPHMLCDSFYGPVMRLLLDSAMQRFDQTDDETRNQLFKLKNDSSQPIEDSQNAGELFTALMVERNRRMGKVRQLSGVTRIATYTSMKAKAEDEAGVPNPIQDLLVELQVDLGRQLNPQWFYTQEAYEKFSIDSANLALKNMLNPAARAKFVDSITINEWVEYFRDFVRLRTQLFKLEAEGRL